MTNVLTHRRGAVAAGLASAVLVWSAMAAALIAPVSVSAAGCASGTLIKGSFAAVYYCGGDGKRYVFVNDKAYFTWYADFSGVLSISDAMLAQIPIGGNVTYRPGKRMVKIQSDPKVYVISRGGVLRGIPDEQCAATLYGADWNKQIDDIPDSFFVNYKIGTPIVTCADYDKTGEMNVSVSINLDKALDGSGAIVLPAVSSVTPAAGSTGAAVSTNVSATFSKKMKAETLGASTFTLAKNDGSGTVAGAVTTDGQTATFDPTSDLTAGTTYKATITTGVKSDDDGNGLSADYNWTFTTAAATGTDMTAPTITAISPPDGATAVALGTEISATFSEPMQAATLNLSSVTVMKGSVAVPGTVSLDGNKVKFTPTASLDTNATYTVRISADAKDLSGNALSGGAYSWSFTTAS